MALAMKISCEKLNGNEMASVMKEIWRNVKKISKPDD